MLEVIEKYQVKRNDSPAFSFSKKNTYSEEANTLIDLEEYITRFPLSQMLFNRYLALCLHKKTISIFNFEELDFNFKNNIKKYFGGKKDSDYFAAVMQISMALTYIDKTIQAAEKYDNNNSIELHKSLALFDKARMEFLFHTLFELEPGDIFSTVKELSNEAANVDFIKRLALRKIKKKFEKSFDYALIDFFNSTLNKQCISDKETECNTEFSIEMIKLISDKINSIIEKEIDEVFNSLGAAGFSNPPETKLNQNVEDYYNEMNKKWRDSPYDIIIFNKSSLCKFICCKNNENEKQDELEVKIVDIIKYETTKIGLKMDKEKIRIHIFNLDEKILRLKDCIKEICEYELYSLKEELMNNLKDNIHKSQGSGSCVKWEKTMKNTETIRYNMWNAAKDWPPNMRSILLFEYYHTLSDKYIFKINEIKSDLDSCSKKLNKRLDEKEMLVIKNLLILENTKSKEENSLLKKKVEAIHENYKENDNCLDIYLEYLRYVSELVKIKVKLEHATEVMETNYEIPDLSYNILKKIENVLDTDKELDGRVLPEV
jgi:hypothetical protein